MGSIYISDFKFGTDRRRKRVAGTPGTLWTGENVVVTRGGDIERAKRFVPTYALPVGQTFGLAEVRGQLWTFGNLPAVAVPLGINYMQLAAPSGATMTQVLDARAANGKLYVIARFADGNIFHYYDGARVTSWDTVAATSVTYPVLADYLASLIDADVAVTANSVSNTMVITARAAGTPFTITRSTTNNGSVGDQDILLTTVQANVPAVAEVRSATVLTVVSGTSGTVSSVKINGVELLWSSVSIVPTVPVSPGTLLLENGSFILLEDGSLVSIDIPPGATDLTALAFALAQSINNNSLNSNYFAVASGASVTITAAVGTGATPNGYPVAVVSNGDLLITTLAMGGGVTAVAGVAQVVTAKLLGTPEAPDLFVITINGVDYKATPGAAATGETVFIASRRVFSTAGSLVVWDKLGDPTTWVPNTNCPGSSSEVITSGTYNNTTGVVTLIMSAVTGASTGDLITVSGLSGSGAFANLAGVFAATIASGTVITYQATAALGASAITGGTLGWGSNSCPATGAGFINVSNDAEGSERLVGTGRYLLNQMAAMTRRNIRLYSLDTDATNIGMVQPVDNTGTIAARSVLNFGSIDLFYLADSGIRSLRPRDTTNTAYVDDIGTAIDVIVREQLDGLSSAVYARAVAVMEPHDDRFWMALDSRIYVLSYFPSSQISAWTYFSPGFTVTDFARVYDKLYARAGDTIYKYGGASGSEYPIAGELIASIELPFAAETPPGRGTLIGFDQAAEGEWQVDILVDPDNETLKLNVGVLTEVTYGEEDIALPGRATHFAVNMTCSSAGYASVSNIVLHTDAKETEV